MTTSTRTCRTLAATLFTTGTALADPSPALDRMSISLGAFRPDSADTTLTVTSNSQALSTGELNLGRQRSIPRVRLDMLLGDSQGLAFDYYRFKRDTALSDGRSFNLGGQIYDLSASLHPEFKLDIANGAYRWWFGQGNTVAGIGVGVAYYNLRADVTATATANGQQVSGSDSYHDDAFAPLVTLGVRHAVSDSVRLYADASGVYKRGGETRGHIYNGALGVEWFPIKNIGLGAEYGYTKVRIHRDDPDRYARLNVHLEGPSAFLRLRF
ncbi:hypothetical protein [Chitinimonas sp.]|uniref:hypothetical protein n=1 Tax=Chitinimonas sp. TaxID=1934313 RepID=UPI002F959396